MMGPRDVLIVGVEDDPSGMLRLYIKTQYPCTYVLVEDAEDQERARKAWDHSATGHLFMECPPAEAWNFEMAEVPAPREEPTE